MPAKTLLIVVSLLYVHTNPSAMADQVFRPASFLGLVVGKATVTEVRKRLGPPKSLHRDNGGTTWLYYSDIGPVPGKVEFIADSATGKIKTVDVTPTRLTLKETQNLFGPKFEIVRYNFEECLREGDSAPLYEAADGPLEYVVYSHLGVALSVDGTEVERIIYLSQPLGKKVSQCKGNVGQSKASTVRQK